VTAVLEVTPDVPAALSESADGPASWLSRVGAFSVDVLLGIAVIALMAVLALAAPVWSWVWWIFVLAAALTIVAMAVNRYLLPDLTGWSLGRGVCGIAVRRRDGRPAGLLRLLLRDVAHLLDTAALFLGWLWPLWDNRHRTFADLLLRTEVRRVGRPKRDMRRMTAVVLMVAALVSGAGVGLGYLAVYRPEQAVDQARAEIAEQGPRIVEQMLSYGADNIKDDFNRAQSLATDTYRSQLVNDQQAVLKGKPTSNEYWSVSSAVLSATQNQAAMLLAMQGQRGTDPKSFKFITATVRVDFEKSHDGHWRVANLTVLKQPQMQQGGR
jgi:Mce-associated membrane protein